MSQAMHSVDAHQKHIDRIDNIDRHARQAWALSAALINHYTDVEERSDGDTMPAKVKIGLMENLVEQLEAIQELNRE